MKTLLTALMLGLLMAPADAATTINATNKFAYGANIGWVDWRGDTNSGAVIGDYVCSGYLYAANVGWIHLGDGTPVNLIQYQNNSGTDYGVNHDGLGNLRGYAYGANIGWINFENLGGAKVDLFTGKLSGSVYSANCGWISLSNAFAQVQTDIIAPGIDTDGDGIADAWELSYTNSLAGFGAASDSDSDGATDKDEYFAGTHPLNPGSVLAITAYSSLPDGTFPSLTWNSVVTRRYRIHKSLSLTTPVWFDSGLGLVSPDGATTTRTFADTNAPLRFYRIQAIKPLSP